MAKRKDPKPPSFMVEYKEPEWRGSMYSGSGSFAPIKNTYTRDPITNTTKRADYEPSYSQSQWDRGRPDYNEPGHARNSTGYKSMFVESGNGESHEDVD